MAGVQLHIPLQPPVVIILGTATGLTWIIHYFVPPINTGVISPWLGHGVPATEKAIIIPSQNVVNS